MASARRILQAYRRHLQRRYTRAIYIARHTQWFLKSLASTIIASVARGRLARRRYVTEQHLAMIKASHPLLVKHALKQVPGQPRVFWYQRAVELQLIFANYLDFVERTGFNPPRIVVERNIAELSRRILARKHELIVIVQKRWRGFLGRRIVRYFRTEIHRIFSITVANAMKIQAAFRGHIVRRKVPQWRAEIRRTARMQSYLKETRTNQIRSAKALAQEKALIGYKQERAEEKTARFLDKMAYVNELPQCSAAEMKSTFTAKRFLQEGYLQHFQASEFGDDRYLDRDIDAVDEDQKLVRQAERAVQDDLARRAFMNARIAETGPVGYGLRSGISSNPHLSNILAAASQLTSTKECSRSKAMRAYFARELAAINTRAFDRVNQRQSALTVAPRPSSSASSSSNNPDDDKKKKMTLSMQLRDEFRAFNRGRLGDPMQMPQVPPKKKHGLAALRSSMKLDSQSDKEKETLRSLTPASSSVSASATTSSASHHNNSLHHNQQVTSTSTTIPSSNSLRSTKSNTKATGKGSNNIYKNFAYPKDVNFNAMAWLYQDDDDASIYN